MLSNNVWQSACPSCRQLLELNAMSAAMPPTWLGVRFASTMRRQNSRMVLSSRDRVARPRLLGPDGQPRKPPRRAVEGPWAGTNRTEANINPMRRLAMSRAQTRRADHHKPEGHKTADEIARRENGGSVGRDRRSSSGFKALNMQRALATISYGKRMGIKDLVKQVDSFEQFYLMPTIQEALSKDVLRGMTDIKPTPIQKLAVPALLGQTIGPLRRMSARNRELALSPDKARQEFLIAAETGTGKTLAYLLPIINAMKTAEENDPSFAGWKERTQLERELRGRNSGYKRKSNTEPHPYSGRPRIVILVPTAELVDQVREVARKLSHIVKFRCEAISANYSPQILEQRLFGPGGLDILISTPHLLSSVAYQDPNILARVTHLIIDEADSLFDRSFGPITTEIMDKAMPTLQQLICCSATIPRRLDMHLAAAFPKMKRITTPNLHAIPRRVQLSVIDASHEPYHNNKSLACADAIFSIGKEAAQHQGPVKGETEIKRVLVFVNQREKTQEVAEFLVSKGIDAIALHRDTEEKRRSEALASFMNPEPLVRKSQEEVALIEEGQKEAQAQARLAAADPIAAALATVVPSSRHTSSRTALTSLPNRDLQKTPGRQSLENTKVIVATDLASRGIDTLGVRHVVLYDVPNTTVDFIHRIGRAGRMGRRGKAVVIVGKDDRRDVVAEVKESMFMGQALV